MKTQSSATPFGFIRLSVALLAAMVLCALGTTSATAAPLMINIVAVDGNGVPVTAPAGYRWTVEEDRTKLAVPGQPATTANYSFSFHTSYMPVVGAGRVMATGNADPIDPDVARLYATTPASLNLDASKRYYVSVAAEGFQVGGAPVVFGASGATATVTLIKYPVPTAQISVLVFNDNSPVNNSPDVPQEQGLEGFTIQLLEAGGTYGQSGGQVTQDAFGNPLGTTYSDVDGTVLDRGTGIILTDANGVAFIKNLYPAKYTILIVPRIRPGEDWHQTSTIEGTKGVDAWVKNNEPPGFYEFGPPGYHVFYGFVNAGNGGCLQGKNPNGTCVGMNNNNQGASITGRIVSVHDARPPVLTINTGPPVPQCWVALNNAVTSQGVYTAPCLNTAGHVGEFTIPNVSPGTYELVVWDEPLDTIISFTTVTVGNANVNLGDVPQLAWFGRYQGRVFQDIDGTGLPYFIEAFDRPYVYVNPMTGVEEVRQQNFAAGDLKPALGAGVASNIRFRDGSIYQSTTTKDDGTFAFTEVFPFFNWTVAEIDYARFKATSASIVVDNGGPINAAANLTGLWGKNPSTPYTGLFGSNNPALAYNPWTRINPQPQRFADGALTDGGLFRMENCAPSAQCAILLEGMSLYANQTNHIEWGKVPYTIEENGGIAGIVYYGITRAEDDPRYAAAENWEPGIPRVQVNVYLDCDGDGRPDQPKNDGSGQCSQLSGSNNYAYDPPDVDNYPFCWRDPESCGLTSPQIGPEDFKRVPDAHRAAVAARQANVLGVPVTVDHFLYGDVFRWGTPGFPGTDLEKQKAQTTWGLGKTDAWDDSIPTDCPTRSLTEPPFTIPYGPEAGKALDCWDGLRNWNQLRPSVFDGGYAFGRVAGQAELPMIIGAEGKGTYIIEVVAPPGYLHQGNGDKNVVFGDVLASRPAALPHECVGIALPVPQFLTLFPGEPNPNFGSPQYGPDNTWRKCDMKAVPLLPGLNAAPNFFMFTEAPVAGHGMGLLTDDLNNTFDPLSPNWGEKYAPPDVPISIQDWTGRELQRVYSDQYGRYNFLVPSTFTINPPYPSGVMPNMIQACLNHPGPIPAVDSNGQPVLDPNGQPVLVIDPYFSRRYTQQCYTLQYLPGKTTYLDTPMLPVAAFASVEKTPLDCECENHTPAIYSATNANNGPWVQSGVVGTLTIVSPELVDVPNPAFDPAATTAPKNQRTIQRDYGFGPNADTPPFTRSVTLGGNPLPIVSWDNGLITATVPASTPAGQHQLLIKRGDNGKESVVGLTVHVGGSQPILVNATGSAGTFKTIQAAIEALLPAQVAAGALITIAPGNYNEALILDKRVRLQGWGAGSTFINPIINNGPAPVAWRALLDSKAAAGTFDMLPGQTAGINPATGLPSLLGAEEQSGVLVLGKKHPTDPNIGCANTNLALRVDGLAITGSITGGGIMANGYACGLQVSNNRVFSNSGTFGGGIRIGHTALINGTAYVDAVNRNVNMHHNWIAENGSIAVGAAGAENGGGGGITLGTGSNNYTVASNYICGNFSLADGAGVSHFGQSPTPAGTSNTIARNTIIFNQNFDQDNTPSGAGLSIAAPLPLAGGTAAGTGDVTVNANLFQGNQAGTGPGAAVSIARTLIADDVVLTNNMIVNNVTGYAGAVSLSSVTASVRLVNNTIANNVSTATTRQAFEAGIGAPTSSQIAGLALLDGPIPTLLNNIFWGNRSYIFVNSGTNTALCNPLTTGLDAAGACLPAGTLPSYRDLGAFAGAGPLEPRYSVLSDNTENQAYMGNNNPCTNTSPNGQATRCNRLQPVPVSMVSTPLFVKANDFTDSLKSAATVDEGGNFVSVIFSPLTLWDIDLNGNVLATLRADYHIKVGAIAVNNGRNNGGANGQLGSSYVPAADFDAQTRVNPIDIGADEIPPPPPPPALTSISPTSGAQGATGLAVNFVGTNLAGATTVTVSGTGVTCAVTGSTATTVAASCNIIAGAAIGVRTVTVTTPTGTSGTVNFTVVGPLKSITGVSVGGNNSGGGGNRLVTVTVSAHGYATGNHVAITGVTPAAYNGTKTITRPPGPTGVNTFTYTVSNNTGNVTGFAGAQAQLVP